MPQRRHWELRAEERRVAQWEMVRLEHGNGGGGGVGAGQRRKLGWGARARSEP